MEADYATNLRPRISGMPCLCVFPDFIAYSYSIRASIYCVFPVHEMEYLVCLFQLFHLVQRFFWIFGDILLTCVI